MKIKAYVAFLVCCLSAVAAAEDTKEIPVKQEQEIPVKQEQKSVSYPFPDLISYTRIKGNIDYCGEEVPLEDDRVRERIEKELLLFLWNRPQVILWLKRSGRYMPHVEAILKANGLPDDLKYLAVVESAMLPHIGSSKRAIGFWQFIKSTGLTYGLTINGEIDERRNIFLSTKAAARYLKKLYKDFGSWTLSVAAYNMGEHGLRSRIRHQGTNEFFHLYLPMETQRHISKIIAAKLIMSNPAKFGFHLTQDDFYPKLAFDRVEIQCKREVSLKKIADAAGSYLKYIKDLNPEIRGYKLREGTHIISIPENSAKTFYARFGKPASKKVVAAMKPEVKGVPETEKNLQNAVVKKRPKVKKRAILKKPKKYIYIVKTGDFLSMIADKFNVSIHSLVSWNDLSLDDSVIYPGQHLIVYMK